MKACSFPYCGAVVEAHGLCQGHYTQMRRGGPLREKRPLGATVEARIWRLVTIEPNTACWLWLGTVNGLGYGMMTVAGRARLAHRLSYENARGPIPSGLDLDHLCRQPSCVNPAHLEPVTHRENVLRGASPAAKAARATACRAGHAYNQENTRVAADGSRQCRECDRLQHIEARRRRVA